MKKITKIILIVVVIIFIALALLFFWRQSKCGDNICQKWEQKNETCANDCKNIPNGPASDYKIKSITTIAEKGGRVDWSPTNDYIAYDSKGDDKFYDIWTMNPDGSNKKCLTCEKAGIPQKMNGNPTIHSSGNYIVFQAEDPNLSVPFLEKWATHPGGGINNNLWVTNRDGSQFWQLTHVTNRLGVLHPHFSPDGTKLLWSERIAFSKSFTNDFWGQWSIKIADFNIINGEPKISNIQEIQPGNMGLYEVNGFSKDNSEIFFSASKRYEASQSFDEFSYNLKTQKLTNFTNSPKEWDEFAMLTPNQKKIILMSSMGINQIRNAKGVIEGNKLKSDFWIMDADGKNLARLTHFNEPGYSEYNPAGTNPADYSWSPDGSRMAVKTRVMPGNFDDNEKIIVIEFEKHQD